LTHTGFPKGDGEHLAEGWKINYWQPMEKKFLGLGRCDEARSGIEVHGEIVDGGAAGFGDVPSGREPGCQSEKGGDVTDLDALFPCLLPRCNGLAETGRDYRKQIVC